MSTRTLLLLSAARILFAKEGEFAPEKNLWVRMAKRVLQSHRLRHRDSERQSEGYGAGLAPSASGCGMSAGV